MTKAITIKRNDFGEYEVPTPSADAPDSVYFTDDRDDAVATVHAHHGRDITVRVRRGSYQSD